MSARRRWGIGVLALGSCALAACSYDFDHFAKSSGGAAGQGGSAPGGSTASGGVAGASGGTTSAGGASGGSAGASGGTAGGGAGGATSGCPSGQTEWMGHCYFTIGTGTGAGLIWTDARAACSDTPNTHLVTINSAAEQTMLAQTFFPGVDIWIGLALLDPTQPPPATCITTPSACPFIWVTGESLTYTNWATYGEPNYSGACVRMRADTQQWADYGCTTALAAICETE